MAPVARWGSAEGVVVEFDEERGTGTMRADDGRLLFFHCTQIAGGNRTIATGTRVRVEVVAGQRGRWEAAELSALSSRDR